MWWLQVSFLHFWFIAANHIKSVICRWKWYRVYRSGTYLHVYLEYANTNVALCTNQPKNSNVKHLSKWHITFLSYFLLPPAASFASWPQLHRSVWRGQSHWEEGEHTHHGHGEDSNSEQLHEQLPQLKGICQLYHVGKGCKDHILTDHVLVVLLTFTKRTFWQRLSHLNVHVYMNK